MQTYGQIIYEIKIRADVAISYESGAEILNVIAIESTIVL
jgi:hypothetical protein